MTEKLYFYIEIIQLKAYIEGIDKLLNTESDILVIDWLLDTKAEWNKDLARYEELNKRYTLEVK